MRWPNCLSLLAACSLTQAQSLKELISSHRNLSSFEALLNTYPDLYSSFNNASSPITVFAPGNDAFDKVPYQVIAPAFTSNDTGAQVAILQYHFASGRYLASSLTGSFTFAPTLLQNQSFVNATHGQVVALVQQAGNTSVAVSGLGSRSTLEVTDLTFDNGVLHILDTVLVPPVSFMQSAPSFNLTSFPAALLSVENTGLPTIVEQRKDVTIFAPSSAALYALGSTLSQLSSNDLVSLLEYHIVVPFNSSGTVYTSDLLPNGALYKNGINSTKLSTLEGGELTISFAHNSLFVNSAQIIQQDLLISNGVLHVIDNVLDPNNTSATANPTIATQAPILTGSPLSGDALPFTSELPTSTSVLFSLVTAEPSTTIEDGSAATGAAATSDDGSSAPRPTSSGLAVGVSVPPANGIVLGLMLWVLGFL